MEISRLYVELQNAMAQAGKEVDLSSTVSLSMKITELLVKDLHFCLSKNIEGWLWRIWKLLIDSSKSKENEIHIVISLLTQLSLGLHLEYKLFPHDLPPLFGISPVIAGTKQRDLEEKDRLKILGFIALRMGDLQRYKGELESAEKFYHIALVLQPFKGEIWNQLGVTAKLRGSFLNAVYYHIRALHSPVVFQGASTNVASILKKYSEKEDVSQLAPRQELYLTVLAKIHFMLPISEELIDRLGSKLLDVRTIAPLLAIYSTLGENTDIEKVSKRVIEQLLKLTFLAIVERFESAAGVDGSLLSCLSLLLRLPAVWQPNDVVARRLQEVASSDDTEFLQFFTCLEDPLVYPIEWSQLQQLLTPEEKKEEDPKKREGGAERERRRRRTVLVAPLPH